VAAAHRLRRQQLAGEPDHLEGEGALVAGEEEEERAGGQREQQQQLRRRRQLDVATAEQPPEAAVAERLGRRRLGGLGPGRARRRGRGGRRLRAAGVCGAAVEGRVGGGGRLAGRLGRLSRQGRLGVWLGGGRQRQRGRQHERRRGAGETGCAARREGLTLPRGVSCGSAGGALHEQEEVRDEEGGADARSEEVDARARHDLQQGGLASGQTGAHLDFVLRVSLG